MSNPTRVNARDLAEVWGSGTPDLVLDSTGLKPFRRPEPERPSQAPAVRPIQISQPRWD